MSKELFPYYYCSAIDDYVELEHCYDCECFECTYESTMSIHCAYDDQR